MAKLNRDGVELYYETRGSGPVLLLTHGYSATSQMWRGQIDALSKTHTLVLWDMRGHGESDYPEDQAAYSEAETVADMAALLDHLSAPTAVVGGLSLGGYMSLAFHRVHADRVTALLIIDTGPGYRKDEPREGWNANAIRTAEDFEANGLKRLERATPEMRTSTHRNAAGLARAARGMLTQRNGDVIASLPEIKVPSLVLVGSEDKPFLAATDYMAAKIPGARKVVIEGAGHAANIDKPAEFNAAVVDFLKTVHLSDRHALAL